MIEPQFAPFFDKYDLANLPNRNAFVRTTVDGQSITPFSMETVLPQAGTSEITARETVKISQEKYGRAKADVERELESGLQEASG